MTFNLLLLLTALWVTWIWLIQYYPEDDDAFDLHAGEPL